MFHDQRRAGLKSRPSCCRPSRRRPSCCRPSICNAAGGLHRARHRGHGLCQHTLVGHPGDGDVAHVLERPARVVVGPRVLRRVVLDREIHVGQRPERLVAADDVVAGGHGGVARLERGVGRVHLEALAHQLVEGVGRVGLAALRRRDVPGVQRAVLALVDRALVLEPVVLEIQLAVLRHVLQREEHGRLLDVGVVARPPLDLGQRRVGAEPLLAGHRGPGARRVVVGPVALHLVEAADGVVRVRDEEHVVGHPPVVEPVGPHAGHAALGHLHHVVLRELPPLADDDGVEGVVVGAGARRRIQVGLRLVQVVHHRGMPLHLRARHGLGELQELAHAVAVVVVLHVLAPVHQRQARVALRPRLVEVVGVHLLLAAVHLDHGRDERDHVVADALDERRLLHHQPVGQLDQHLGAAVLRRVDAAREVVDRLGRLQQRLRLRIGGLARIGERAQHVAVLLELLDGGLVRDGQRHDVAALLGRADGPEAGARRHPRQLLVVAMDVLGVRDLAGLADDAAEELEGGGHGV